MITHTLQHCFKHTKTAVRKPLPINHSLTRTLTHLLTHTSLPYPLLLTVPHRRHSSTLTNKAQRVTEEIASSKQQEEIPLLIERQASLHAILEKQGTWDDTKLATQLSQELSSTTLSIDYYKDIESQVASVVELCDLAIEENDDEVLEECSTILDEIQQDLIARRIQSQMSSEQDQSGCYMEIVSGAGGADAFHWTKMLANMYAKWASNCGYVVTYIDEQHDDSAGGVGSFGGGYRRVTLRIEGEKAHGWLRAEAGVHRLVRKSPFDPSGKRHTSFAQVCSLLPPYIFSLLAWLT